MEGIENEKCRVEISKPSKDLNSVEHLMKVLGTLFLFSLIMLFSTSLFAIVFRFIQLFISNLSKSYIFLICNGILVLIVKNSGSAGDSSEGKSSGESSEKYELCAETKVEVAEEEVAVTEVRELEPVKHEIVVLIEQQGQEGDSKEDEQEHQLEHEDEEQKQEHENEGEDDHDGDEEEEMSREELNKKCEDFIRMMRHNIKLEAHQLTCYYA